MCCAAAILFMSVIIYCLFVWVVFTDISMEPIDKQSCIEINSAEFKPRLPVTLISYADGHEIFYKNQNFQVLSGLNKGIDQFILYKRNMINPDFYKKNVHILQEKFGAGDWLWKPQIILQTMKAMPKDSVIIYMDSGFSIKNSMQPIFKALGENDVLIAEAHNDYANKTVEDSVDESVLKKVGINLKKDERMKSIWAAFIVVKNTKKAREFVETWLSYCKQEELIKRYQNDQTLLSLVYHKLPEKVSMMQKPILESILEWHHRKTNTDELCLSLLPSLHKHITGAERRLLNFKPFRIFRDFALTHLTNIQNRLRKTSNLKLQAS